MILIAVHVLCTESDFLVKLALWYTPTPFPTTIYPFQTIATTCDTETMKDSKVRGVQRREATFVQTCDFACKIASGASKILEIAGIVFILDTCMMSYLMRHLMTTFLLLVL